MKMMSEIFSKCPKGLSQNLTICLNLKFPAKTLYFSFSSSEHYFDLYMFDFLSMILADFYFILCISFIYLFILRDLRLNFGGLCSKRRLVRRSHTSYSSSSSSSKMDGFRSALKRGSSWVFGDWSAASVPEKDSRMLVADSLLSELDFHVKELNRLSAEREREEKRIQSGVDYSWLMTAPPKVYQIPQLERLELEELCLKVREIYCLVGGLD
jgi:hypothetical protein